MQFILECQDEYNKNDQSTFPLEDDEYTYGLLEKEISLNLFNPDKIDDIVSQHDFFPTNRGKWKDFIALLKLYRTQQDEVVIVMSQTNCSHVDAVNALKKYGNIVDSILELTP